MRGIIGNTYKFSMDGLKFKVEESPPFDILTNEVQP